MKRFGHAAHAQPFSFLTGVAVALVTVNAIAQEPAAPAPAPAAPAPAAPAPAAPAPAAPAPAAPAAEAPAPAAPAPAPAAEEMPPMEAAPAPTAEPAPAAAAPAEAAPVDAAPVAAEAAAEAPAEEEEASTGLTWNLFVDGSYSYTTARSGTPVPTHRAWETNSFNSTTGRTTNNGFNLHWLGLDAAYDAGEFAATGSLRFGTAVPIYFGANRSDLGTENLTQAYVSWRPADKLNLDLGQFNTIYGAEVAESWKNLNYSRGALYYAMQPSHHTGLRINYAISDAVTLNGLIVNGANTVVDDNDKPSVGLQIAATPSDSFSLYAGYLGAFEPSTDVDLFSHFFDLVATVKAGDLTLVLNGDYNIHADAIPAAGGGFDNAAFFGVSAAAGYQLSDMWGLALRFEHLGDSDNSLYGATTSTGAPASDVSVNTLTGTIDVKPVKGVANLIVRWDNRLEFASEEIFFNKDSVGTDKWFASILGVVVQTNN